MTHIFQVPGIYTLHTLHVIKPVYEDHLCITTIFYWPLWWPFHLGFALIQKDSDVLLV